jgi:hypothetical protein
LFLVLFLLDGVASKVATEFLEDLTVYFTKHDGGVYLTATKAGQLFKGTTTLVIIL